MVSPDPIRAMSSKSAPSSSLLPMTSGTGAATPSRKALTRSRGTVSPSMLTAYIGAPVSASCSSASRMAAAASRSLGDASARAVARDSASAASGASSSTSRFAARAWSAGEADRPGAGDCAIARRKSPRAAGMVISESTDVPPADSPKIVTFSGSPPNAAMLSRTHRSAAIWSKSPALAWKGCRAVASDDRSRNPNTPTR